MQTASNKIQAPVSRSYQHYVLVMLTGVYVFNFVDRQLLVILQESIKKELRLSDTQLGMLSGFTFAIFYVTLGIPIARLADKKNRRNIVATALGLWSLMTACSGLARNFIQLLLARIGVGVGEAGGSPPAHAMISDYFPPEKRSTALSVYSTGIYFGVLIGFLMGGYLNQHLGWRTAFFALGIPGLVFSLLFYTTVKEPVKGATDTQTTISAGTPSLKTVLKLLASNRIFVILALATALHVFCLYGLLNWAPSFLSRLHGMKNAEIGFLLGLIYGLGGAAGSYTGGFLTDHFGKKDRRNYLRIPAYVNLIAILFIAGYIFLQNNFLSLFCLGFCAFLTSMYLGPSIAVAHSLVPAPMRALTSAILFFVMNLIGLGFGPLMVGFFSDLLKPALGLESLRWALSHLLIVETVAAVLFFSAAKKLPRSAPVNR
jgi:predicted MFS family arabinose efflux permease